MNKQKIKSQSKPKYQQVLLSQLHARFPEHEFFLENFSVIHTGRFANAVVYRYQDEIFDFVIKDFQHSPWFVRLSFARMFINQEYKALKRLSGMPGISNAFCRLSSVAVAYEFIEGTPLRSLNLQDKELPASFFKKVERMVVEMHHRGLVHLDLRNLGNIICGKDGQPYFIDFQSAMTFQRFPRWLQRYMRGADLSGIYKGWKAVCEHPMPRRKRRFFDNFNKLRKGWVFKGYPVRRACLWFVGLGSQVAHSETLRSITEKFF